MLHSVCLSEFKGRIKNSRLKIEWVEIENIYTVSNKRKLSGTAVTIYPASESVLRNRDVYPGSRIRTVSIPDPNYLHPGSRIRIKEFKGIDRPFWGEVKSSLIRSLFINWRLGKFFLLILKGFHHKISKKPIDAA
jgi:hypothetical protein